MTAQITAIDCEPACEGVLETLDYVRALHEEGKISSIYVNIVYRDGSTGSQHSRLYSFATMLGSMAMAQARLIGKAMYE